MELYHAEREKALTTQRRTVNHKDARGHEEKRRVLCSVWGFLRASNDVVGRSRKSEGDAALLVQADGLRQIEVGELNFLCPVTLRPVVTAFVKRVAHDRVTVHFLARAVAERKHGRRQ